MAPKTRTGAIDDAEAFIIGTADATYRKVAEAFGLSANTLRARIDNKYGCLRMARQAGYAEPERVRAPVFRQCIRCKGRSVPSSIHHGQRMCDKCRKEIASIHDGAV